MALQSVIILGDMDTHWKPGEYESHAESLKKAVDSFRKDPRQQRPEKSLSTVSASNKRKPAKKPEGLKLVLRLRIICRCRVESKEAQSETNARLGNHRRQTEQSRLDLGLRLGGSTGKI